MKYQMLLKKGPMEALIMFGKRVKDANERATMAGARVIQRETSLRAPFDTGTLQAAVYVTPETASKEKRIIAATEYAEAMHEGTYNLGARSKQKQARVGVAVGKKFMSRAISESKAKIDAVIARVFKNVGAR